MVAQPTERRPIGAIVVVVSKAYWPRRRTRLLAKYLMAVLALLLAYTAVYRTLHDLL